jgi:hypothetical protein
MADATTCRSGTQWSETAESSGLSPVEPRTIAMISSGLHGRKPRCLQKLLSVVGRDWLD